MLKNFFSLDDAKPLQLIDASSVEGQFANSNELINAEAIAINFPERCRIFEGRTFRKVKFNQSNFSQSTFKRCKFEDCLFVGCAFSEVEFHDTYFYDCNFYKSRFHDVYIDIRLVHFDKNYQTTHSNVMLGFYQEIFKNYSEAHQWKFILYADIQRRRWDRFQSEYEIRNWKLKKKFKLIELLNILKKCGSWLGNWISDVLMSFGYSPFKFIIWTSSLLTAISAMILHYWDVFGFKDLGRPPEFSDALFYVSTIWSTLGYSSLVPSTATGSYVSSFLGLAGLAWTGLFIATLIRRFVR